MAKSSSIHLSNYYLFGFLLALVIGLLCEAIDDEQRKVYIVYMGSLPKNQDYSAKSDHISMLQTLGHDNTDLTHDSLFKRDGQYPRVKGSLIRSYTRSFNGFVANLTLAEAIKLESMENVVSVIESQTYHTQTTRSWDYIGFPVDVPRNPPVESDIIIGSIDTGIIPEFASFSDQGLDIVPKKWKGVCSGGKNFTCNKKLIGARYYGYEDARDTEGHGTHTAATAAGRVVPNTSFFGIANGTARGAVPGTRIATYKVCDQKTCKNENILAAFDDAIADGVDIITISLGSTGGPIKVGRDIIALGAIHAWQKGILTVQSAGNNGTMGLGTTVSIAPWLFSVAANSVDRKIINKLVLGNKQSLKSVALNTFSPSKKDISLVLAGKNTSSKCDELRARQCVKGCVDPTLVKGKIIVCDTTDTTNAIEVVMDAGAEGVVLKKDSASVDVAYIVPLPAAILSNSSFPRVLSYLNSTRWPHAHIKKSKRVHIRQGATIASFSGRGPNQIFPEIFKPDISAPGIHILAAFSPTGILSDYTYVDKRSSNTAILSGTSMACPHVSGAAAYVKSIHPDWSVSAIKSALMTTAYPMKASYNGDAELGYGSGQINPLKATNPGLVYETFIQDYINMFCSLGFEGFRLKRLFGIELCPKETKTISPKDLNYPSMTAPITGNSYFNVQFSRVVTNVGHPNSTYRAKSINTGDKAIHVKVEPSILSFTNLNERKSFVVTVSGQWRNQDIISYSLVWYDKFHRVRSPILLYRNSTS